MDGRTTGFEADSLSRERILREIEGNFFVEAGAGSGKTSMLVRRMTAMVEAGIRVGKICAITFTRAAAGEFYERFQKLLIERSSPAYTGGPSRPGDLPCPTEESRRLCRTALMEFELCFMGTIDSFCGMILSEHPTEAGFPSDARIASDEEMAAFYAAEFVRISGGDYGEELRSLSDSFRMLHRRPQEAFSRGMTFLMNNRNVRFHYNGCAGFDPGRDLVHEREELIRALTCLTEHPELRYDGHKDSRDAWDRIRESFRIICGRWDLGFSNLLYALGSLKKIRVIPEAMKLYGESLGPVFAPGGKQNRWLEFVPGREGGLLDRLKTLQYDVSMTFLHKCVPQMEKIMHQNGCLTYFDCLYSLRNMLKKDAETGGELIRYIRERHSYYLIDEFQDTNPMQAEVFFYLAAGQPVPQWSACVPRPGSLFIVGDPKQSIYRFRSADVASFLKVKKLFESESGAVLKLSRNFRSKRTLCEYYNRVFRALLPAETENQSRFEEIPLPEAAGEEFQGVFTYRTDAAGDPKQIAEIIGRLVGNGAFLIRGTGDTAPRPVRYGDIMVITYGKRSLAPILAELDAQDIPSRVEGDVPFSENKALAEIVRLYCALSDAGDASALYGALTGSVIGLSREDLLLFRSVGGEISLKMEPEPGPGDDEAVLRTAREIRRLRKLHRRALGYTPAVLFSAIMDEFRVYGSCPDENLEVVFYALELLRNAEKTGQILSLRDGADLLRTLLSGSSGEERCLALDAGRDCVHMANLHKVKGLEAPVVILSACGKRTFPVSCRTMLGESGPEGWLFSLSGERDERGVAATYFETDRYEEEKAAESEALRAEGDRLIYVAATRAGNALILSDSVRFSRGRETHDSRWEPIMEPGLPDIFDVLGEKQEKPEKLTALVQAGSLYGEAEACSALKDRGAETPGFRTEFPSRLHVASRIEEPQDVAVKAFIGEEAAPASDDSFPALLGTMVHRLMEMLVSAKGRIDAPSATEQILQEYLTPQLSGHGEKLRGILNGVAGQIRRGGYAQTNGAPQDILKTLLEAKEVSCEVPFCWLDEEHGEKTVWRGTMDAVYSDGSGWHIIDYKTNADGNDLDLRYQAQLAAYVRAFRAVTGMDADARTYHIDV